MIFERFPLKSFPLMMKPFLRVNECQWKSGFKIDFFYISQDIYIKYDLIEPIDLIEATTIPMQGYYYAKNCGRCEKN